MDFIDPTLLKQWPMLLIVIGLFVWFWKEMKAARQECDEHAAMRDKAFGEILERNTSALGDLDRTIRDLRFAHNTENDRRRADSPEPARHR